MKITSCLWLVLCNVALAQTAGTFTPIGNPKVIPGAAATELFDGSVFYAPNEIYQPVSGTFSTVTGTFITDVSSATRLADGRVLMTEIGTTRAELYDPIAQTFALTGNTTTIRLGPRGLPLPDGRLLLYGSLSESYPDPADIPPNLTAEIYDPDLGTFSSAGTWMGQDAAVTATLLQDGTVLVSSYYGASTAIYDPSQATFTPLNHTIVSQLAVLLGNGKVLFLPSISDITCGGSTPGFSGTLYDPSSKTFRQTAGQMVVNRIQESAVLLSDGTVLLAGGGICYGGADNRAEIYDPVSDTFTATGNMAAARDNYTSVLLPDGTVLMAGGDAAPDAEIYHPANPGKSPALFSDSSTGQAIIWNAVNGSFVSPGGAYVPAHAGDILSTYTNNLMEGGAIPPQISVGCRAAKILYFGDAPGYPGYFQINFQVPDQVTPGSSTTVVLTYLGRPSNAISISVQ